jgi:hypothetical protein
MAEAEGGANGGAKKADSETDKELERWRRRLLPFMVRFIVALAGIFFAMSIFDVLQVNKAIFAGHDADVRAEMQQQLMRKPAETLTAEELMHSSLLILEADALDKRYHQASALLMSRVWTKHLAFLTGMVLAFLGATFVLGRLSESVSTISGSGGNWKTEISSASPGIILAFFGTVLLAISLLVQNNIDVQDTPVYVYGEALIPGQTKQTAAGQSQTGPSGTSAKSPLGKPPDILDLGDKKEKPATNAEKR